MNKLKYIAYSASLLSIVFINNAFSSKTSSISDCPSADHILEAVSKGVFSKSRNSMEAAQITTEIYKLTGKAFFTAQLFEPAVTPSEVKVMSRP